LFTRAQAIGNAYGLHLMPSINIYERTELNKDQVKTLMDEIDFINRLINDSLLEQWLNKARKNLQKVVQSSTNMVLIIEGP